MSLRVLLALIFTSCAIAGQPEPEDVERALQDGISDNPDVAAAEELITQSGKYGQLWEGRSAQDLPMLHTASAPQPRTWLLSSEGVICMVPFRFAGKSYEDCHPDGWCCTNPSCTERATCAEQSPTLLPLLGPRKLPQSACHLRSLGGSFEWMPGRYDSKTTVFMLQDELQGKTWKDEDLLPAVQLAQNLDVDFVLLSYSGSAGDAEQVMKQLDKRLEILQANLTATVAGSRHASLGRFHLVTEPAWGISTRSCWLPSLLHTWSHLETVLTFAPIGDQSLAVPQTTGLGIRGMWSQILPINGIIDGPLHWAGLACSGVAVDPRWPAVVQTNLAGSVALVSRGSCSFYQKAKNMRAAGARAVIIISQDEQPITMGCAGSDPCREVLDIFVMMIGHRAGQILLSALSPQETLNASGVMAHLASQHAGPGLVGVLAGEGGVWRGSGSTLKGFEQEVLGMEYQRRLLQRRRVLEAEIRHDHPKVAQIDVFQKQTLPGSLTATWGSEQAYVIQNDAYDSLEIELHLDCSEHLDTLCPAWDHELNLYLCSEGVTSHPTRCKDAAASIGRWITPYGREGRWISDATAALPLLLSVAASNHSATLHLATWQRRWIVSVTFWFSQSKHSRGVPLARMPLWQGGHFDLGYNSLHNVLHFKPPAGTSVAMLSVLLTGHGWGKDAANCAEFCNHSHHFRVNNGIDLIKAHPLAGTDRGCFDQVLEGAVPNQHGTWPYGRAGWCPGKHVDWWEVDVTPWLMLAGSATNNITYRALFDGVEYDPSPAANASNNGFGAEIHLASVLTFYRKKQTSIRGARRKHVELLRSDRQESPVFVP